MISWDAILAVRAVARWAQWAWMFEGPEPRSPSDHSRSSEAQPDGPAATVLAPLLAELRSASCAPTSCSVLYPPVPLFCSLRGARTCKSCPFVISQRQASFMAPPRPRDPLLPVRAHALAELRRLVLQRHPALLGDHPPTRSAVPPAAAPSSASPAATGEPSALVDLPEEMATFAPSGRVPAAPGALGMLWGLFSAQLHDTDRSAAASDQSEHCGKVSCVRSLVGLYCSPPIVAHLYPGSPELNPSPYHIQYRPFLLAF